jgi:hypothetical protein
MDTPFFSSKFKRQLGPENKMEYWFSTIYTQDEQTYNEKPPFSVEGEVIYSESSQMPSKSDEELFSKLPEEINNPSIWKSVFERWITDCSGAFTKSPTISQCLANCEMSWDCNAPVASMNTSEEDSDWILQWIPTKIKVCSSRFSIYWAPCYKTLSTRIPDLMALSEEESESKIRMDTETEISLHPPENTRRIDVTNSDHVVSLEELADIPMSVMNTPALRLEPAFDDVQREKYRRRVRDARIRAKLAQYRAERLADRFEERFGYYPEEDDDEARTEGDQTEDEY